MLPNILLFIADDHRHDALSGLGHPAVSTPTLDRLMESGVTFTHVFTTVPLCTPARGELLSGCNAFRNGVRWFGETLHAPAPTLPEVLRANGYHTHAIGKWHNDAALLERGFVSQRRVPFGGMWDHEMTFEEEGQSVTGFSSELFADAASDFVTHAPNQPWFCYVAFTSPHDPRTPPPAFRPDAASIPLPPDYMPEHPFDNGSLTIRDECLEAWPRTQEAVRSHLADYYGMIAHHDACIGRVLEALAASGQAENTMVIYTGDHGLAIGSHGLMGKSNLYDHSLRVPLILRGPDLPTGVLQNGLHCGLDLPATLCDLSGIAAPAAWDSQNLLENKREFVVSAYQDSMRSIRSERWKYIEYEVGALRQLFDLENDPYELTDLLMPWRWQRDVWTSPPQDGSEYRRIAAAMQGHLREWQQAMTDPMRLH